MISISIKNYFFNLQKLISLLSVIVTIFSVLPVIAQTAAVKTLPNQAPEFSVGNIIGTMVNIDSFKLQKEIRVTKGFKFKSASVYFSGANFQNVNVAFLDTSGLFRLDTLIARCMPGSSVTFDNVKLINKKAEEIKIVGKAYLFYGGGYVNIDSSRYSGNIIEILELSKKSFISGTVYFSGANFPNVLTVYTGEYDLLKRLLLRCSPGSILSFENCIFKNTDGTLTKPLTKSIKLE